MILVITITLNPVRYIMMNKPPRNGIFLLLFCCWIPFFLHSCQEDRYFEQSMKIPDGIWKTDHILPFSVMIPDTLSSYDLYIDVRNDISYPYSNLYIFFTTVFPNGLTTRDTIECQLAQPDGKWLGAGMGSIRSNRFLFQEGIRFSIAGTYRFELEQAMRVPELKGIRDIGIRINKK